MRCLHVIQVDVSSRENGLEFRRKVIAGEGNAMGVNKSTLESAENEENRRLSSAAVHLSE